MVGLREGTRKCFLKEANEGLLQISRGISFHIEGAG